MADSRAVSESPSNSKSVRGLVPMVSTVPLDPLHFCLCTLRVPLIDQRSDRHNQVLVQHRSVLGGGPVISLPANIPDCRAVNGVVAVSDDMYIG